MKHLAKSGTIVQRTGTNNLSGGTRQIDLRCVLGEDHHGLLSHPFVSRFNMRLQNIFKRDFLVIEKTIGRHGLSTPTASCGNTCGRMTTQLVKDLAHPFIQTLVPQIDIFHFFGYP
jgi:hypothetical protein